MSLEPGEGDNLFKSWSSVERRVKLDQKRGVVHTWTNKNGVKIEVSKMDIRYARNCAEFVLKRFTSAKEYFVKFRRKLDHNRRASLLFKLERTRDLICALDFRIAELNAAEEGLTGIVKTASELKPVDKKKRRRRLKKALLEAENLEGVFDVNV